MTLRSPRALDDLRQIVLHLRDRTDRAGRRSRRARGQDPDIALERPVQPPQAARRTCRRRRRRCSTSYVVAVGVDFLLQQRGIRLRLEQARGRPSGCRPAATTFGRPESVGLAALPAAGCRRGRLAPVARGDASGTRRAIPAGRRSRRALETPAVGQQEPWIIKLYRPIRDGGSDRSAQARFSKRSCLAEFRSDILSWPADGSPRRSNRNRTRRRDGEAEARADAGGAGTARPASRRSSCRGRAWRPISTARPRSAHRRCSSGRWPTSTPSSNARADPAGIHLARCLRPALCPAWRPCTLRKRSSGSPRLVTCTTAARLPPGALQSLFAQINEAADVLVLCGDLTDYGLAEEARSWSGSWRRLKIPAVAVLGNHDFQSGQQARSRRILADAGVSTLDGDTTEIHGIGFAGIKGFAGGFGRRALGPWGEDIIKKFVHEAVERGAEARDRARAAADRAADRRPPLLAHPGNGRRRAARDLPVPRLQPARGAAHPLSGDGRVSRPRAPRPARRPHRAPEHRSSTSRCR